MGNICRSPTAEGVMRVLARRAGVALELDSAGTGSWHAGELPDAQARKAASRRGYELVHRARQFVPADLGRFDLVIVMDRNNLSYLQSIAAGRDAPPIRLLRDFEPTADDPDVPDPYGGDDDGFERVLDICERACAGLLEHVQKE
jgi:protein-tyrosine phosphatase